MKDLFYTANIIFFGGEKELDQKQDYQKDSLTMLLES